MSKSQSTEKSSKDSHSILIVEDDVDLAKLILKKIERAGFNADIVLTGTEALDWVKAQPETLLLLDYKLPDMTANDLIQKFVDQQIRVPFIILTGQGDEKIAVEMMRLGARDYLIKEEDFLDLLPAVVKRVVDHIIIAEKLVQSQHELQLLDRIHKASLSGLQLEQILEMVAGSFSDLIHVSGLTIYLYDKVKQCLTGQNPGILKVMREKIEKLAGINLMNFAPILREGYRYNGVLKTGKGFIESDSNKIAALYKEYTDSNVLKKLIGPVMKLIQVKSTGVVPLMTQDNPLGLITFMSMTELKEKDLDRLEQFGREVATIVEKVQTEEALKKSEEKFKEVQRISRLGYWEWDFQSQTAFWSDEMYRIYNRTKELGPLSTDWTEYVIPEDKESVEKAFEKARSGEQDYKLDHGIVCMDGEIKYIHTEARIVHNKKGEPVKMRGTVLDITERVKVEKLLKKRQAKIEKFLSVEQQRIEQITGLINMVAQIRVGMTTAEIFDLVAEVIQTNLGWQTAIISQCETDFSHSKIMTGVGLSDDELERLEQSTKSTEGERPSFAKRFLQDKFKISRSYFIPEEGGGSELLSEPNVFVGKTEGYIPGEWKQGDFLLIPIVDREGSGLGLITVDRPKAGERPDENAVKMLELFADQVAIAIENAKLYKAAQQEITERKRVEEMLRESEQKYRLISENTGDLIALSTFTLNPVFTYVSPSVKNFGYKPEDIINKHCFDFIHPEDKKRLFHLLRKYVIAKAKDLLTGKGLDISENIEFRAIDKSGKWHCLESTVNLVNDRLVYISRDITERKHNEEALRESEQRFRTVAYYTYDWEYWQRPDGTFEYVSPSCERITGYSVAEFIDNPDLYEKIILPEDHLVWEKHIKGLKGKHRAEHLSAIQFRIRRKDGEIRWIEHVCQKVKTKDAKFLGYRASNRDITNRVLAEEQIRNLSSFPEENPHPVFSTDWEGKVRYANPAAYELLIKMGVKNKKVSWLLPEERKRMIDTARLDADRNMIVTSKYKRTDHIFKSEVHLTKTSDTAHIYLTDITEQVRREEETKRLLTAVEQTAEGIIITDPQGTTQYVNPMFERITGYSPQEVIGHNINNFKKGPKNEHTYRVLWDTVKAGDVWIGHLINEKKDGTQYEEEVIVSPIRDKADQVLNYVFVCRDVTQEVALEEQFRQVQKLEAIGRLAGGIAHDFNNILTGIIGYADLALASLPKEHPLIESFEAIIKKSDDAALLVRQLLAFSRKQILDIKPLDLNHIILQSSNFLKRIIRDDITFETKLNSSPSVILADATAMQQIITNLCLNAQDAMPFGGKISLQVENVNLDEEFCQTRSEVTPGNYVKLSVSDSGIGIDKEDQEHIFEPFFTTKEVGKGTGLGLSTVYGLAKQHNGYIECISTPKEGTLFELYFPEQTELQVPREKPLSRQLVVGKETILLVEDDLDVLNVLRNALESSGYTILVAKDGLDGFKILKANLKDIDLVITDIYMPVMSGIELYHKSQNLNSNIKFLFITGYAQKAENTIIEPGLELLQKPITSTQLTKRIREIMGD